MTIFYYDVYAGDGQIQVPANAAAIVAKATEGTYYQDRLYSWFKQQAADRNLPFSGYHFLNGNEDPATQAKYYFDYAGTTPCMVDVEPEDQANSRPTVDQTVAFIKALQGLGGHVWGVYFPKWYLDEVGGDLSRVTALKAVIISSSYTSYTETGPGWVSYGGATPVVWQYTSTPLDTNAFKGTPDQLAALFNGEDESLTPEDIAAIAKAVNEYSEDTVTVNGNTFKASLFQLAHGAWEALNDPQGAVPQMRSQLNDLFHRPSFDPAAIATAITPTVAAAIKSGLPADQVAQTIATAVVNHLTVTLGSK